MLGRLVWTGEWQPFIRLREERIRGLTILRAELPGSPAGRGAQLRWHKGVCRLERAGVRRLLLPGQEQGEMEGSVGPVVTRPLWQQMAAPLAVAAIHRAGARPERTVVALRGQRVTQPVFQTCCRLMGAVRALSLTVPEGGEALTWWLERQYGMPVLAEGGDVTLCFSQDEPGADRFLLGEERPAPLGYTVALRPDCQTPIPNDCPAVPLLAALLEEGKVGTEELRVVTENFQFTQGNLT